MQKICWTLEHVTWMTEATGMRLVAFGMCMALLNGCASPEEASPNLPRNAAIQPSTQQPDFNVNTRPLTVNVPTPAMPVQSSGVVPSAPSGQSSARLSQSKPDSTTAVVENMLALIEKAETESELRAIAVNCEVLARKSDRLSTEALMNNRQNTSWALLFLRNAYNYAANCARLKINVLKWGDSSSQSSYTMQMGMARSEASRAQDLLTQRNSPSAQPSQEQMESSIENSIRNAHRSRQR